MKECGSLPTFFGRMVPSVTNTQVWDNLIAVKSLDRLGLPTIDGRIDLRGFAAPSPSLVREYQTKTANVRELGLLRDGTKCESMRKPQ